MAYQAIYRKWRPTVFKDIIGQQAVTETLKKQVVTGHLNHAYLFCGTRGTGKTTAAKILSRAVNCRNSKDGDPCNECDICRGILDGSIQDVSEIDAASNNGVENIRDLRDEVSYVASQAKYKVYIIDEVHMLSVSAFNALLKTLEEPPPHVIFILATTEPQKLPQTILSRCQRYDFRRIRSSDIVIRMKEIAAADGYSVTDEAFDLLAKLAEGSMRDGLSIFERCVSSGGSIITEESIISALGLSPEKAIADIVDCMISSDTGTALVSVNRLISEGRDINTFAELMIKYLHDLLICKASTSPADILDYSEENIRAMKRQAEKLSYEKLTNAASVLVGARADAKWIKSPRVIYELALIRITRPELETSSDAVLDRISTLEDKVKNGVPANAPAFVAEPAAPVQQPKKTLSEKLYKPLPKNIDSSHPIVAVAKKWDKYASLVMRRLPFVPDLTKRQITIDGEGIIMLFDRSEKGSKELSMKFINAVRSELAKNSGADIALKTAYTDELEGYIVDIYSIPDAPAANASDTAETDANKDKLDILSEKFPDTVEFTDDEEFTHYEAETYSQSSFGTSVDDDSDDDDGSEEFLEDSEINNEDDQY